MAHAAVAYLRWYGLLILQVIRGEDLVNVVDHTVSCHIITGDYPSVIINVHRALREGGR